MNVTTEEIKAIKPGSTEAFNCDVSKMKSLATVLSTLNTFGGRPDGIVFYEHKKYPTKNIVIIRAMREGDEPLLNK
jgi:hypothetical protein